jgi:hypothetical protein
MMQCKYSQLQRAIDGFRLLYEVDKVIKEKVNGKLVMEWLDLFENDGPMVGKIMSEVRNIPKSNLLLMSQSEIQKRVIDLYRKHNIIKE